MSPKLSIIVPCYNCTSTLAEAVQSCYTQSLPVDLFEIVMVDDGSTDNTKDVMAQLAQQHTNIRLFFHAENRGGGAARNTGIQEALGELIYCLDSDNIFAPESVIPLISFLESNKLDGVAFYERRFFFGTDTKKFTTHINTILDRDVTLLDLFNETNTLLDNFLYTKASYLRTAGYPEHHGFDTQCFEMRYLSAGNKVQVCPKSFFYHRQAMQEKSYFERVHASGMFSVNFMLIYEDIFHLFTPETQQQLIVFPLFRGNKSYGDNALALLKNKVAAGEPIFTNDYLDYLKPDGRSIWQRDHHPSSKEPSTLSKIFSLIDATHYREAHHVLTEYIESTTQLSPYLEFLSLRILQGLRGTPPGQIVRKTIEAAANLQLHTLHSRTGPMMGWLRRHQRFYQTLQYFKSLTQ